MSKRVQIVSLVVAILLCSQPCNSNADEAVKFEQGVISIDTSLYGALLVDRDGFLWIGTTGLGLYRYDGYELKSYAASVRGSMISSIVEDNDGILWIASFSDGITSYDKDTGLFTEYRHDSAAANSLCSNNISFSPQKLFISRSNILWVGTDDAGLCGYNKTTGTWMHHTHDPDDSNSLSDNSVMAVTQSGDGALWVGTQSGGLNRFDPETGIWTHYKNDPNNPNSPSSNWISSILEDKYGMLFFGTKKGGLNRLDKERRVFTQYAHDPADPRSIGGNDVWSIHEDHAGKIWISHIGSPASGLDLFDKESDTFTRSLHDPNDPSTVGSNAVSNVHEDQRTKTMWVVNYNGQIDRYDRNITRFRHWPGDRNNPNSLSDSLILPIIEDSDNMVWVGTFAGGLNRIDRESGEIEHFLPEPREPHSIPHVRVEALTEDSSGILWIGFWDGILSGLDRKTGRVIRSYNHVPGDSNSITDSERLKYILEDRDDPNILWLATIKGGFDRFDKNKGAFKHYKHDPDNPNSVSHNSMATLYDDGKGVLWIPTYGGGLDKFDKKTGTFKNFRNEIGNPNSLGSDTLYEILEMSNGELWISRKGGISRFNPKTETFSNFNEDEDGTPYGPVGSLLQDDEGKLWLGTVGGGIVRFDPMTGATKRFTMDEGLQSNTFFWTSRLKAKSGELWFGGSKGISSFHPSQIKRNLNIPPIVLTAFTQGGEPVPTGTSPERLREVTLDWRSNYFEFQFAALDFTAPKKNRYAYMLEGWDKEWYYAGISPFGRYSGLPGGRYTLRLKGSNNDGVWNDEGISVTVVVRSPFWETALFTATVFAVGLVFLVTVVFYLRKLRAEIAERRRAENRVVDTNRLLENVINSSQDFIFVKDTDLRTILCNKTFAQALGKMPEDLYGRTDIENGWSPEFVRGNHEKGIRGFEFDDRDALNGSIVHNSFDPANVHGEVRYYDTLKMALRDGTGDIFGVLGISRDITERRQAEAEQDRLQRKLQQAQKMEALGQLTGGIAHDFNNILGIMLGYTELAVNRCVQDDRGELAGYLDHVVDAGFRAKNLVAQMLASTRGEIRSNSPLYLEPLVGEGIKMIRAILPTSIEISTEIEEDLPSVAVAPVQVHQLLINLCINARDAMEGKGAINIRLSWVREAGAECAICHGPVKGDWIGLSVEDTGDGISATVLSSMFDPFFTTKEVGKGTGLGLSVVSGIMRSHEGHVLVETEQGKGTAVRLLFPPAAKEIEKTQTADGSTADLPSGQGERILVVDDEPGLGEIIGEQLQSHGYRAAVLTSSQEALELFERNPDEFALVITDQTMPGITGVELVNALRQVRPDMPAILNTGFSDHVDAAGAAKMGIRYLEKPVNAESLILTVGELLQPTECRIE